MSRRKGDPNEALYLDLQYMNFTMTEWQKEMLARSAGLTPHSNEAEDLAGGIVCAVTRIGGLKRQDQPRPASQKEALSLLEEYVAFFLHIGQRVIIENALSLDPHTAETLMNAASDLAEARGLPDLDLRRLEKAFIDFNKEYMRELQLLQYAAGEAKKRIRQKGSGRVKKTWDKRFARRIAAEYRRFHPHSSNSEAARFVEVVFMEVFPNDKTPKVSTLRKWIA